MPTYRWPGTGSGYKAGPGWGEPKKSTPATFSTPTTVFKPADPKPSGKKPKKRTHADLPEPQKRLIQGTERAQDLGLPPSPSPSLFAPAPALANVGRVEDPTRTIFGPPAPGEKYGDPGAAGSHVFLPRAHNVTPTPAPAPSPAPLPTPTPAPVAPEPVVIVTSGPPSGGSGLGLAPGLGVLAILAIVALLVFGGR